MKYEEIVKDLKNKIYHPIYFLQGEEPYYIDKISDYIEANVLNEAEKSFNLTVIYGKDLNHLSLLDVVRRYPMMSNYQVVILKEAQQFKDLEKLTGYFEKPMKSTVFVICHKYKKLDQRTSFAKLVASKSVVFTSNKIYENQVPAFIDAVIGKTGQKISPRASQMLTEFLGNDLSKIELELEKLSINVANGETIMPEHIEKYIGVSKDYNVFELTSALVKKDVVKVYRIVNYFIENPKANHPIKVMGALYSFFGKAYVYLKSKNVPQKELMSDLRLFPMMMNDLRTFQDNYSLEDSARILEVFHEYDLKSKGVEFSGSEKSELLKEMVYLILNPVAVDIHQ